jgi:hypothetical protein
MIFKVYKYMFMEYQIDCDTEDEAISIADSYDQEEAYNWKHGKAFMLETKEQSNEDC